MNKLNENTRHANLEKGFMTSASSQKNASFEDFGDAKFADFFAELAIKFLKGVEDVKIKPGGGDGVSSLRDFSFSTIKTNFNDHFNCEQVNKENVLSYKEGTDLINFLGRTIAFLMFRTFKSNPVSILRSSSKGPFIRLVVREAKKLSDRFGKLGKRYKGVQEENFITEGQFSFSTILPQSKVRDFFDKNLNGQITLHHGYAQDFLDKLNSSGGADIIITDPPYGFNTDFSAHDLSSLFDDFIDKSIKAIRDGGQLIICLPSVSYNGQKIPYFVTEDVIVRQVITKAEKLNKPVRNKAMLRPSGKHLFEPPYVWRAKKALSRSILHFSF